MWEGMALTKDPRAHRTSVAAPPQARVEEVAREIRVEELRRRVANGTYKVDAQRLALRILCRALDIHSPEKRT